MAETEVLEPVALVVALPVQEMGLGLAAFAALLVIAETDCPQGQVLQQVVAKTALAAVVLVVGSHLVVVVAPAVG